VERGQYTGPIVGIEDGDDVVRLICKAYCEEVLEEAYKADISKIFKVIQARSGKYVN
jgi:hypothetical protein